MSNETPERIVTIFGGAKCGELDAEYAQARRVANCSLMLVSLFAPVVIWE